MALDLGGRESEFNPATLGRGDLSEHQFNFAAQRRDRIREWLKRIKKVICETWAGSFTPVIYLSIYYQTLKKSLANRLPRLCWTLKGGQTGGMRHALPPNREGRGRRGSPIYQRICSWSVTSQISHPYVWSPPDRTEQPPQPERLSAQRSVQSFCSPTPLVFFSAPSLSLTHSQHLSDGCVTVNKETDNTRQSEERWSTSCHRWATVPETPLWGYNWSNFYVWATKRLENVFLWLTSGSAYSGIKNKL